MIDWQPIETAPEDESRYFYGYDLQTAVCHCDPSAGISLIRWFAGDDEEDAGWEVMPLSEGLDIVNEYHLTHWAEIPTNIPVGAAR